MSLSTLKGPSNAGVVAQESRKMKPPSTLEGLLLRPKEIRMKQYREPAKR